MGKGHEVAETNFADLRDIVRQLAQAQLRTEARVDELAQAQLRTEARLDALTVRVDELAQAQLRTEARVDELAQAQLRTEARLNALTARVDELAQAQLRTEARLDALTARVDTLALRLEELTVRVDALALRLGELTARVDTLALRTDELARAQLRTEHEIARLRRTIETQVGGLGARWGMQAEEAFRNGLKTILEEVGFRVERYLAYDTEGDVFGRPDQVELDVVVQDGKVIVIEIKSSLDRGQVHQFSRKVAFYARKTGQQVARRVIVTPFTEKGAQTLAEELGIEICTDVSAFQ
jgi:hypothetical protein